jgi:L-lactate dehydrogenase
MVRATKDRTQFATSTSVCRTLEAILLDKREVLTVSTLVEEYEGIEGVCLSMPAVVGANGIERVLKLKLADDERQKLLASAEVLRSMLQSVEDEKAAE